MTYKSSLDEGTRERSSYPSNSHEKREKTERKIEKVVKNGIKVQDRSRISKLKDIIFVSEPKTIVKFILDEVVKPQLKEIIFEIGTKSLGMSLFGDERAFDTSKKKTGYDYDKVSIVRPRSSNDRARENSYRKRRSDYKEVEFYSKLDAQDVLRDMKAYLNEYSSVSIMNFYEFAGADEQDGFELNFMDDEYGWYNLDDATVVRNRKRDKWIIDFPRPVSLD